MQGHFAEVDLVQLVWVSHLFLGLPVGLPQLILLSLPFALGHGFTHSVPLAACLCLIYSSDINGSDNVVLPAA